MRAVAGNAVPVYIPGGRGLDHINPLSQLSFTTRPSISVPYLELVRKLLRHADNATYPFVFRGPNNSVMPSEHPGLEGFLITAEEFQKQHYLNDSVKHYKDIQIFITDLLKNTLSDLKENKVTLKKTDLLKNIERTQALLEKIDSKSISETTKYTKTIRVAHSLANSLQQLAKQLDKAYWVRSSSTYHIYMQAFDIVSWRECHGLPVHKTTGKLLEDLRDSDFAAMQRLSFDNIRLMGLFEKGRVDRKGSGSPFAIRDYSKVDPSVGTEEDLKRVFKIAKKHGINLTAEIVFNHTSKDSVLLKDPTLFVHTTEEPKDKQGYFKHSDKNGKIFWIREGGYLYDGKREYWSDTLQLDLSNPATKKILIAYAVTLATKYNFKCFRVDMAYQMINEGFSKTWSNNEHPNGS